MLIPGTGIGQPRWSSGLVFVCVGLGPSLHDAFLGSRIKTPQPKITTPADRRTLRHELHDRQCSSNLAQLFALTVRHHASLTWSGKSVVRVPATSFLIRTQRRPSSKSRSLPLPDRQVLLQYCHPHGGKALGEQELSDTAASFVSDDTGRHCRIAPVSLAHQPELEVDSLVPFVFNYRWRNTGGGVSVLLGTGALPLAHVLLPRKKGAPGSSVQGVGCGDRC